MCCKCRLNWSLLCAFALIAGYVAGCAENSPNWDKLDLPNGGYVLKIDVECCDLGSSCGSEGISWRGFAHDPSRGEICDHNFSGYETAGDEQKAIEYALKASDLGYDSTNGLLSLYNKIYGRYRTGGPAPQTAEKTALEEKMASYCGTAHLLSHLGVDGTEKFCEDLADALKDANNLELTKRVWAKNCEAYRNADGCSHAKTYHGQVVTKAMLNKMSDDQERREEAQKEQKEYSYQREREVRAEERAQAREDQIARAESDRASSEALLNALDQAARNLNVSGETTQDTLNRMNEKFAAQREEMLRKQQEQQREAARRQEAQAERQRQEAQRQRERNEETHVDRYVPIVVPPSARQPTAPEVRQVEPQQHAEESHPNRREPLEVPSFTLTGWANREPSPKDEPVPEQPMPPTVKPSAPSPSSPPSSNAIPEPPTIYQPGGEFNNCVSFSYDPKNYNWYTIKNSCSEAIHWVTTTNMSDDTAPGRKGGTAESADEVARHPGWEWAICRAGYLPYDAEGKFWTGGMYRCGPR